MSGIYGSEMDETTAEAIGRAFAREDMEAKRDEVLGLIRA